MRVRRRRYLTVVAAFALLVLGCASRDASATSVQRADVRIQRSADGKADGKAPEAKRQTKRQDAASEEEKDMLHLSIDGNEVEVAWEDNESVRALADLAATGPLSVSMHRYGGFEQVGSLGSTLPSADVQTTTAPGDIVLYASDQIVVFYGSNSWAYTRLGHVSDRTAGEMAALLGSGDAVLTITVG